jgi:hypothetical protein
MTLGIALVVLIYVFVATLVLGVAAGVFVMAMISIEAFREWYKSK